MARASRTENAFGLASLALLAAIALAIAIFLPPLPGAPMWQGAGAPEDRPHRGGTFVFYQETDLRSVDPHATWDEVSSMIMRLLFETLIEIDHDVRFAPRIARELPELSEDGLTYTFRLRDDAKFANGRAIDAEDVLWSMEHMLDPEVGCSGATFYGALDGFADYQAGRAEHVRGIRVIDAHTIEFRLTHPTHTFLYAMAMPFASVLAREGYEGEDSDPGRRPISSGAFMLQHWEPGTRVTFVRNPHFFRAGEPYVDRMVFELNLTRGPAFMRFLTGEVDHTHRFTPTDYLWFRRQRAWEPYSSVHPMVDIWGLEMNTEMAPFTDRHVRRAVAFAINRQRWNLARANRLRPAGQPVPEALAGHDPSAGQTYDLARAREEMALAGHPVSCTQGAGGTDTCVARGLEDQEIDLWIGEGPTGQQYGVLAVQDLAAIGLRTRLHPVSFPLYLRESGRPHTVQMLFGGWSMDYPDASNFLEPLFHSRSALPADASNRSFYRNPDVDALIDRASSERDADSRAALYRQASRIVAEDAPWAFIFSNVKLEAWQPYVRNYRPHPVHQEFYRDVWLDEPRRRTPPSAALSPLGATR